MQLKCHLHKEEFDFLLVEAIWHRFHSPAPWMHVVRSSPWFPVHMTPYLAAHRKGLGPKSASYWLRCCPVGLTSWIWVGQGQMDNQKFLDDPFYLGYITLANCMDKNITDLLTFMSLPSCFFCYCHRVFTSFHYVHHYVQMLHRLPLLTVSSSSGWIIVVLVLHRKEIFHSSVFDVISGWFSHCSITWTLSNDNTSFSLSG